MANDIKEQELLKINEHTLLVSYRDHVRDDQVQFVGAGDQRAVLATLDELIELFPTTEIEGRENWHERHRVAKQLWKQLVLLALHNIDNTSKGNAKLIEYLKAATQFEDALYGLEDFYRDHTLHSLWVYFLGDFLLRERLSQLYEGLDWYLYDSAKTNSSSAKKGFDKKTRDILNQVNNHKDATWCLIALCHDLGYSLSKLGAINERASKVLDFFDLERFDRVGYRLQIEHQFLTSQLLELMADEMYVHEGPDNREAVTKLYRDDEVYWALCDSLERREHGTLSAYVLYKLLGTFGSATIRGPAETWGLENDEAITTLIRGLILFAIAQHSLCFASLNQLGSLADLLVLTDEAEEFSRWGRPIRARPYVPTIAKVSFGFRFLATKRAVNIKIQYDVHKDHQEDLASFFNRKADKLACIYSLASHDDRLERVAEPFIIQAIEMVAQKGTDERVFYMTSKGFKARLPSVRKSAKPQLHDLEFRYDEDQRKEALYVIYNRQSGQKKERKEERLDKWPPSNNKASNKI